MIFSGLSNEGSCNSSKSNVKTTDGMTAREFIGERVTIDNLLIRTWDGEQLVKFDGFWKLSLAVPGSEKNVTIQDQQNLLKERNDLRSSVLSFIADAINEKIERSREVFKVGDQVVTNDFDDLRGEEWGGSIDMYTPFLNKIGCVTSVEQGYDTVWYTVHGMVWPTIALKRFEQFEI